MVKPADNAPTGPEQLAETLRVLTEAAPGLRAAGVKRVQVGAVVAELGPPTASDQGDADQGGGSGDDEEQVDIYDLGTFRQMLKGRSQGGRQ